MSRIAAKNTASAIRSATRDNQVTEKEVGKLGRAVIKDLVAGSDQPEKTLKDCAARLGTFLEPFRANDLQEAGGVWLGREQRYDVSDLQSGLEKAADQLDEVDGGLFGMVMGLALQDGRMDAHEAGHLRKLAKKVVESSDDPDATAMSFRKVLLEMESAISHNVALDMGPGHSKYFTKGADKTLADVNAFLGQAIATGIKRPGEGLEIKPDSDLGKAFKELAEEDGWGRAMMMETLPSIVDKELARYDSTGLTGPAKLKMEKQTAARAAAILSYVEGLNTDGNSDDLVQNLYRITTGHFMPPAKMDAFKTVLQGMDSSEIRKGMKSFSERLDALAEGESFSMRNERAGLEEGLDLLEAELARRADVSGLSSLGNAASKAAVLNFLDNEPMIKAAIADGASIDRGSVKFFDWSEAKTAIKDDQGPQTNLDVVLGNWCQDYSHSSRDLPDMYAFARVAVSVPHENQPIPLVVIMAKGDSGWTPTRMAEGEIPF